MSNIHIPDVTMTTIQRMSTSEGKQYTGSLDLPQEEFERLIQQYSKSPCSERQHVHFTGEDIAGMAKENEEFFTALSVKTEGFEKVIAFLMPMAKQIWNAMSKKKSFRLELYYDAEKLNTNYFIFTPTDKKNHAAHGRDPDLN